MERIALVSDIHANAVALEAALADIDAVGVSGVVCLGDVATLGPRPREVVGALRERCCALILGNHDEYMFAPELVGRHSDAPPVVDSVAWARDALAADDIAFLRSFAPSVELDLGGCRVALFHGSPLANDRDLLATTPDDELEHELASVPRAAVMAGGHTHLQLVRQHRGRWLVNPGSVGMPFERFVHGGPPVVLARAEYALIEVERGALSVALRRVPLDRGRLIDEVRGWDAPLAPSLLAQYLRR
jgi:predicted phosphodiesterase